MKALLAFLFLYNLPAEELLNGRNVVLTGPACHPELGMTCTGSTITVKVVVDLKHPERYFRWAPPETVARFTIPPGATPLLIDQDTHQVLAFAGQYGKGRFLYLATPFDPLTRYPYFAEYLEQAFGLRPLVTRPRLEVYFDPGFRPDLNLPELAATWHKWGIRIVYVAAWHASFDYRRFISECHRAGIAVYAWFELPMVSKKFWDEHPEWRAGERVGWRYLMNLANPQAMRAALDYAGNLVDQEEWDGVNLAEMNYDSPVPDKLITALHRRALEEMEKRRRTTDFEVIVTMLDGRHAPRLRKDFGIDWRAIVKLMDRFPFTLQVQDPSEFWATSSDRYLAFGKTWRRLVKDPRRLMFDMNIVAERDVEKTLLSSALATGTEFARTLYAASQPTGRAAIYSEWTVTPQDWSTASAVLAAGTRLTRDGDTWRIEAPRMVAVRTAADAFTLDGEPWPVFDSESVLIPAGKHVLRSGTKPPAIRLLSLTGELLSASVTNGGIRFAYDSPGRCIVVLSKQPSQVRVDNREWTRPFLPSGRHSVEMH